VVSDTSELDAGRRGRFGSDVSDTATVGGVHDSGPCDALDRRVLLIGAGGHARVCVEVLREADLDVVGALDRDGAGDDVLGVPVVGRDADLASRAADLGVDRVCVAIGDNAARRTWSERAGAAGLSLLTAVAASAVVSPTARLGPGAQILPGAVVNAVARIGRGVIVNTNASVDHDVVVGDFAHVAPGAVIGGDVRIGASVLVGLGARVAPGLRIGDGAIVGAGAVVVRDVPPGVTVVGVPAGEVRRSGDERAP
jgi:UDP-perosamine 4-acetyltransferase